MTPEQRIEAALVFVEMLRLNTEFLPAHTVFECDLKSLQFTLCDLLEAALRDGDRGKIRQVVEQMDMRMYQGRPALLKVAK